MAALLWLLILSLISLGQGHAAVESSAEAYWETKLGKTPMPKVVKDGLKDYGKFSAQQADEQVSSKKYGLAKATQVYSEAAPPNTVNDISKDKRSSKKEYGLAKAYVYSEATSSNVVKDVSKDKRSSKKEYGLAKSYVYSESTPSNVVKDLSKDKRSSNKKYRLTKPTQVYRSIYGSNLDNNDDPVLFFLEDQLTNPRLSTLKLQFTMSNYPSNFLPPQVAKSIPFSSTRIKDIQNLQHIKARSISAKMVEETLTLCETKAIRGEEKACTRSLESMIDFVTSRLGNKVQIFSTEIENETPSNYKVEKAKRIKSGTNLVCHKMDYPYAVFYCHTIKSTDVYSVSLVGVSGKRLKAIAVCHRDTSSWNPRHLAFQLLRIKPGSVPICHFVYENTIVWVPSN